MGELRALGVDVNSNKTDGIHAEFTWQKTRTSLFWLESTRQLSTGHGSCYYRLAGTSK